MTLPTDDDYESRLRSGRRISRPNDRNTNPPPPDDSSLTQLTYDNDCDTNPPPPGDPDLDFSPHDASDSQLSQSLLSDDAAVCGFHGHRSRP